MEEKQPCRFWKVTSLAHGKSIQCKQCKKTPSEVEATADAPAHCKESARIAASDFNDRSYKGAQHRGGLAGGQ